MIDDLADEGTTIILSSHILPIVEEHADIVGVSSRMANSSPKERLPSFSAAPKRKNARSRTSSSR